MQLPRPAAAVELSHSLSQSGQGRRLAFPASPSCSLRTKPLSSSSLRLMEPGQVAAVAAEGARDLLPGALLGGGGRTASG